MEFRKILAPRAFRKALVNLELELAGKLNVEELIKQFILINKPRKAHIRKY